ncbi:hypothetical protein ACOSQ4_008808 [Xanthoceras sorbifolium]
MQKTITSQYFIGESSRDPEVDMSWPFRLKLTTDSLRWDSLKISPSDQFEEQIVAKLDETSRNFLVAWRPVEIHIIDVDIHETYRVNLIKKEKEISVMVMKSVCAGPAPEPPSNMTSQFCMNQGCKGPYIERLKLEIKAENP